MSILQNQQQVYLSLRGKQLGKKPDIVNTPKVWPVPDEIQSSFQGDPDVAHRMHSERT